MINVLNKKAGISCIEILILIIAVFAFSYLLSSNIEKVDADDSGSYCCEKTIYGNICMARPWEDCNQTFKVYPGLCEENTEKCQQGCCVSSKTGLCDKSTSRTKCESEGGYFEANPDCNIQKCRMGCCILKDGVQWTTDGNCKFEANAKFPGTPYEWKNDASHNTWTKCSYSTEKGKEGACIFYSGKERKCIFTTAEDCETRTGNIVNFDKAGRYCSNKDLNTTCKAHDYKGCLEGKDDVYWFDSCGNHEEIAQECNLMTGTYCGKSLGNYICKDVNCNIDGKTRKNGESWCEYDGKIGDGKDLVGSRYILHLCYMGTERIQPCADYRNEICVQSDTTLQGGEIFSQANCRVNNWRQCMGYNAKKNVEEMESKCKKNPDCNVKTISMNGGKKEGFYFKVCTPAYPPGFTFDDEYEMNGVKYENSAEGICSTATQRCTETWICGIFGCHCVQNCDCHTAKFTTDMNDLCISLGDCGAYVNYIGTYTDGGYSLKSTGAAPPRLDFSGFSKFAGPQAGQKPAAPGNFEFFSIKDEEALKLTDISADNETVNFSNYDAFKAEINQVAGSMGSPLLLEILSKELDDNLSEDVLNGLNPSSATYSSYFNSFASVRSAISSQIVNKNIKTGGFEMIGALIAATVAYLITQSVMIALIAGLLLFLFLISWIEYVDIDFICNQWEQPSGGDDCNKCNQKEIPCSKYRCQSLGAMCQFINEGTPNELCVAKPGNGTAPVINPLESVISENYSYFRITANGFEVKKDNEDCIDPFTAVRIGIKVDPFAKCRFGIDPKLKYEEMSEKFGRKGDSFLPAHQMYLALPTPEAVRNMFMNGAICNQSGKPVECNLTKDQLKDLGTVNLYVKCKTAEGKTNPDVYKINTCVNQGPDLTAPTISEQTFPTNNGFSKFNSDNQSVTIFVSEPATCKWSINPDLTYDQMENTMTCDTNLNHYITSEDYKGGALIGLPCNATFTGLKNTTEFYIKCKDKSENNNTMVQNFIYKIIPSASALIIEDFIPQKGFEMTSSTNTARIDLKLQTSGGSENGKANCSWIDLTGMGMRIEDNFYEKDSTTHTYLWKSAPRGIHNVKFTCEDSAGNIAQNITNFKILVDNIGPIIVRVYNDGGLKIITDEKSKCAYNYSRNFNFDNSSILSGEYTLEHSGGWEPEKTYHIQCIDERGVKGEILKVRPFEIHT